MIVWLLIGLAGTGAPAEGQLIDKFDYRTSVEARQVWLDHADRGRSQRVGVVNDGGRSVLELPVPFAAQPQLDRVYIDRNVQLNLAAAGEFGLEILSTVPEAAGRISLYFRSGDGWYAGGKGLEAKGWQTLRFSKAAFAVEGQPAGWHQIDGIRIAVWRESSVDFQIRLRALHAIVHNVALVIPTASDASEVRTALQTAEEVGDMLAELGLGSDAIEDEAIAGGALGDRSVAILAYNPGISDAALEAIVQFVERGGKVLACYQLPPKLATTLGFAEPTYFRPSRPGELAEVRFDSQAQDIAGLPGAMRQSSWNITRARPAAFHARIIAEWFDDAGQATGQPAMLLSDRGAFFSHIILRDDLEKKEADAGRRARASGPFAVERDGESCTRRERSGGAPGGFCRVSRVPENVERRASCLPPGRSRETAVAGRQETEGRTIRGSRATRRCRPRTAGAGVRASPAKQERRGTRLLEPLGDRRVRR